MYDSFNLADGSSNMGTYFFSNCDPGMVCRLVQGSATCTTPDLCPVSPFGGPDQVTSSFSISVSASVGYIAAAAPSSVSSIVSIDSSTAATLVSSTSTDSTTSYFISSPTYAPQYSQYIPTLASVLIVESSSSILEPTSSIAESSSSIAEPTSLDPIISIDFPAPTKAATFSSIALVYAQPTIVDNLSLLPMNTHSTARSTVTTATSTTTIMPIPSTVTSTVNCGNSVILDGTTCDLFTADVTCSGDRIAQCSCLLFLTQPMDHQVAALELTSLVIAMQAVLAE